MFREKVILNFIFVGICVKKVFTQIWQPECNVAVRSQLETYLFLFSFLAKICQNIKVLVFHEWHLLVYSQLTQQNSLYLWMAPTHIHYMYVETASYKYLPTQYLWRYSAAQNLALEVPPQVGPNYSSQSSSVNEPPSKWSHENLGPYAIIYNCAIITLGRLIWKY